MSAAINTNTQATNFGASAFRLSPRQWPFVIAITTLLAMGISPAWKHIEQFERGADYRLPYRQSNDYWLYQWHLEKSRNSTVRKRAFVIGDSVIWGEYVKPSGTLSHFLSEQSNPEWQFVNAGVNGQFPLALEGLVRYYGAPLHNQKVLLHCNLLWMSSPEADLSASKEQTFNHVTLVPQFRPRIPCYRASRSERISISVRRRLPVFAWTRHLQTTYFDGHNIPQWTLQTEPRQNAYRNPFAQITGRVRREDEHDDERGPQSDRHRAWYERGLTPQPFAWVVPEQSLQWAAFQRLCELLVARGNDVMVVVGPFNTEMLDQDSQEGYAVWQNTVPAWLVAEDLNHIVPKPLPSAQFGDASHPLTDGYRNLATDLLSEPSFQDWLAR